MFASGSIFAPTRLNNEVVALGCERSVDLIRVDAVRYRGSRGKVRYIQVGSDRCLTRPLAGPEVAAWIERVVDGEVVPVAVAGVSSKLDRHVALEACAE